MLQHYTYYGPHPFEDLHRFICEALTLVCKSTRSGTFSGSVVKKVAPEFQQLMQKEAANKNDYLYRPLEELFLLIQKEPPEQKELLLNAIKNNNEIADICRSTTQPLVQFKDIQNKEIADKLKTFLNNLYEKFLSRSSFVAYATDRARALGWQEGTVINFLQHFRGMVEMNEMRICPFCGIYPMLTKHEKGRNDYDHFLPKGVIPFISVNFRNLAPMCGVCNSTYKQAKVPVFSKGIPGNQRVKTFYPYAESDPQFAIGFKLQNKEARWEKLQPEDIALEIKTNQQEEANSWNDIFEIDTRYKAWTIASIKEWLNQLLSGYQRRKKKDPAITWDSYIEDALAAFTDSPLLDQNFLKYASIKCLLDEDDLLNRLKAFAP